MKRLLAACILAIGANEARAQEEPTGSWADETSSFYFARGGSATDGAYHYLFGGYQLGASQSYPSYYRRARRYDPAANAWISLANLPIVSSDITYQFNAGAFLDGVLYSFGTSWQEGDGIILAYSISDDAWTVLSGVTLPGARYGAAAAVLGDRIYISGGFSDGPSRRVDEFNPVDSSFTQVADLPIGLHVHAMAAVPTRGSLFAIGGLSDNGYVATCFEYSAAADTWTERAPMIIDDVVRPRGYLAAFTLRNRVYATGGRSNWGTSAAVYEYHPGTDSWTQRASMASARYQHAAVAIGGRGYVYGGLPVYSEGEEFTPPDFGPAPELESPVVQIGNQPESSLQAQADPSVRDGWIHRFVTFSATISDPDPSDLVRLRVRIRRPMEPLWTELESPLVSQGMVEIRYTLPTASEYDWEYRIEDEDDNSFPEAVDEWLPAFGNSNTPDLRCDFTAPTEPSSLTPRETDVAVPGSKEGDVVFTWKPGTDLGSGGVVHDLEVALPEGIEHRVEVPTGEEAVTLRLAVRDEIRQWRVRARDLAGNVSAWSEVQRFRVTHDDRVDHAAGDLEDRCSFGATGAASAAGLLLALLAAGSIVHRRFRRRVLHP